MTEMNEQYKQGFSSEQQLNIQTVQAEGKNILDEGQKQRIRTQALKNIEPAEQIKKKQYSLQPDMLSGWKPKIYISKPIPLVFYNDELDYSIEKLIKMKIYKQETQEQNKAFIQLVYLGPRYESTYSAWYEKPFPFPYTHLNSNKRLRFTDRQFVGQYWNAQTQNHLHFDSFFQSGNLDVVFKIGQFQYDLFMRVDSNTKGHLQWYNFKVKNMKRGNTYKINICNFLKEKSLYTRGMKPYVLSKKRLQIQKIGWSQEGQNIKYEKKTPRSFKICKTQLQQKPFRLSFDYQCIYQHDEVQFAYCIPYPYSKLKDYLQNLQNLCKDHNFLKVSRMAFSLGGLEIPILTITSDLKQRTETEYVKKKLVVASGRIHPGQSNGSFMMEGFIEFICRDTEQSKNLRDNIVFKIIPMVNPDGVVLGNYRTSLSGKDLNRQFITPDQYIFPEIYHLKKNIWKLRTIYRKDFFMYLDFHGHSTKKNCFTYGPQFPITNSNYYECRIFPRLISMNTEMFRYFSCIFKVSECKQQTLRALLLKYFEIDLVYTIEVSNGCFYDHQQLKDECFNQQKFLKMGELIGKAVHQYISIFKQIQDLKKRKKQQRLKQKIDRQKIRLKTVIFKRQTKRNLRDKERLTRSVTKSPINFDFANIRDRSPNQSPNKSKKNKFSNLMINFSNKSVIGSGKHIKTQDNQDYEQIPQLDDDNFNSILKEIYGKKPSQNQALKENQTGKNQQFCIKQQKCSDDDISEGGSDSSSQSQDLNQQFKRQLFKSIKNGSQKIHSVTKHINKAENRTQKKFNQTQKDQRQKDSDQQNTFMTEMDESTNELEEIQSMNKLNNRKFNELRSKKQIYLKKKSYQLNMTPSPKKQQKTSQTAKIVNFQFSLQPIKPASHVWIQKDTNFNSIHSLIKLNSEQKLQRRVRQVPLVEYMTRASSQVNVESRFQEYSQNFRKTFLSVQRDMQNGFNNSSASKINNQVLLRKTQERKPIINASFYRNLRPNKNIEEENVKGRKIFSSYTNKRCKTEFMED